MLLWLVSQELKRRANQVQKAHLTLAADGYEGCTYVQWCLRLHLFLLLSIVSFAEGTQHDLAQDNAPLSAYAFTVEYSTAQKSISDCMAAAEAGFKSINQHAFETDVNALHNDHSDVTQIAWM